MNQPLFEIEGSAPFTVYRTGDGWTFAANTTGRTYASAEGAAAAAVAHAELALSIARSQVGIAAAADRADTYHACGPLTVVCPINLRTAAMLSGSRVVDAGQHAVALHAIKDAIELAEEWMDGLEPCDANIKTREGLEQIIGVLRAVQR